MKISNKKYTLTLVILIPLMAMILSFSFSKGDSLLGSDSNHNGIRDDLEDYIQKTYPNSQKRRALLLQMAKDYQSAFSVIDDPIKLEPELLKISQSINCDIALLDYVEQVVPKFYAEMNNNFRRSIAFLKIDELLFHRYSKLDEEDILLRGCRFDLSKMEN